MKRLFILSLLMMQGLWGAAAAYEPPAKRQRIDSVVDAANMPASVTVQTNDGNFLELVRGDYLFFRTITNMLDVLPKGDYSIPLDISSSDIVTIIVSLCKQIRDNNGLLQQSPDWINNLEILGNVIKGANHLNIMIDSAREHDGFAMFVTALYVAWLNANPIQPIIGRQTARQACIAMGIQNPPAEWNQIFVDVSDKLHDITSLRTRPGTIAYLVHTNQMPYVNTIGVLDLSNKGLTVCDVWSIPNPQAITDLDLSGNHITALVHGTFAGLDALKNLNLSRNQLTKLAPNTFAGLNALRSLFLHFNLLTTLPASVFAGLTALTNLYLSYNQLTALPVGVFAELGALTDLYLYNNQLTTLEAGTFAGLGHLTTLWLSNNQLTTLAPGTFAGLNALITLLLRNNQLTALAPGTFAGFGALNILDLSHNQLTTLAPGIFTGLTALTSLRLAHNQITTLVPGAFTGLNALVDLWLSDNPAFPFHYPLQTIKEEYPEWFSLIDNTKRLHHRERSLRSLLGDEPQFLRTIHRVEVRNNGAADDDVCPECSGVGDASTCSADAAG